ncbi:MAG: sigma 54-interacting transcriptional regulator [Acidaminococcales bacterium]|jgi:transcriptional regulator with PAS, ATPase and Fis domain|nr:sigma 54-interacting transcriptional regulator [Acidaminococcales bacterium]
MDCDNYTELSKIFQKAENGPAVPLPLSVLDALQPTVVITDAAGRILYINKQREAPADTGAPKMRQAMGCPFEALFREEQFTKILKEQKHVKGRLCHLKSFNMDALVSMYPLTGGGKILGFVVSYININELSNLTSGAQYYKDLFAEDAQNREPLPAPFQNIIGNCRKMYEAKFTAAKIAASDITVLLMGESGVGKELFAEAIHNCSNRRNGPLVKTNCAAIPEPLLESELFGYDGGAFTGAKAGGKKGKFELSDGGTIFLDEIGDMGMSMQTKLLRVLQEKEIERVGGARTKKIDVRIVAATNKNICQMVKEGEFREDLYYRLAVVSLKIPPLRERKEDILLLADYFLKKLNLAHNKNVSCAKETIDILLSYFWRGNIRELQNVLERAFVLCSGEVIGPHDLPEPLNKWDKSPRLKISAGKTLETIMEETEKEVLKSVLKLVNNNRTNAMKMLGVSRRTLYKKLNKYNID